MCRAGGPRCTGGSRRQTASMSTYAPPPAKPKRMSEKRYRELYDSTPVTVVVDGSRIACSGAVSAEAVANTYRKDGKAVTFETAAVKPSSEAIPAAVTREQADQLAAQLPADRKGWDGQPLDATGRRMYALRESGYQGPIDQDGYPDTTSESAGILRRMATDRGESVDW